jgi:hypothetical protein
METYLKAEREKGTKIFLLLGHCPLQRAYVDVARDLNMLDGYAYVTYDFGASCFETGDTFENTKHYTGIMSVR